MVDGNIRPIVESDEYFKISLSQVVPFYKIELAGEDGEVIGLAETDVANLQSGSGELLELPEIVVST